jgi:hypothetical protein
VLTFIDVSTRLSESAIQHVLMPAVGYPTPEKLKALARLYAGESTRCAYALFDADTPVGVIALERGASGAARYTSPWLRRSSARVWGVD